MCSTAGLLADGAGAAGTALLFELAFALLAAWPRPGESPGDTRAGDDVEEPGSLAFAVLREPSCEVVARAEIMPRVFVASLEMEQIDHHRHLEGAVLVPRRLWLLAFAVAFLAVPVGAQESGSTTCRARSRGVPSGSGGGDT